MRLLFFIIVLILLGLACQPTSETGLPQAQYESEVIQVHRKYYSYGQPVSFMDEYGRVIREVGTDTTFLQYCKDSTTTISQATGLLMKSNKEFCYQQKEVFLGNEFLINPEVHQVGQVYRRNVIKGMSTLNALGKTYEVYRMMSVYSQDMEGQQIVLHSNEYWSHELGLLLKIDEDFIRKRRRVIQLHAFNNKGSEMFVEELMAKIQRDSADWVTRNSEGEPWF